MTDDELRSRWSEAARQVPAGSRWRHRKGGRYTVLTVAVEEATLLPVVVYLSSGAVAWTRPLGQFLDGRFTREVSE